MNEQSPFQDQRLAGLFGISWPIIQGGMVWVSGAKLAAAVSQAGALGLIGSGSMKPALLRKHIRKARTLTTRPFGVNIPLLRDDADDLIKIIIEEKVPIVFTSAGSPKKYTSLLKDKRRVVVHVVPAVRYALKAEQAGCDAVVAEGFEAGGHNGVDMVATMALVPQVVDAVRIPVIAAGGIADGRGIAAALALGAAGVQIGTRFAVTTESSAHENYKRAVSEAGDNSTVFAMHKIGPARMISNDWTARVQEAESRGADTDELRELLGEGRERLGIFEGDLDEGQVEAGQGGGLVRDIPSAGDLVHRLVNEYQTAVLEGRRRDCGDRRERAEEELARERELLRTLIDNLPDEIYFKDAQGRFFLANSTVVSNIGASSINDIVGKTDFDYFSQEQAAEYRAVEEEILRSGEPLISEEIESKDPSGHRRVGLITKVPLRDSGGKIYGLVGINRDITDWQQAEEALRESEERFRSLYENATIGIYRTTPDGRILLANPAMVRMLGYSSFGELEKHNLEDVNFRREYDREKFRDLMEKEGVIRGSAAMSKRPDGSTIHFHENTRAIRGEDSKIIYYEGTIEDITERKRAEQALRRSEAELAKAQRMAKMGNWERNLFTGEIHWSDQTFRILGLDPGKDKQSMRGLIKAAHPEDRQMVKEILRRASLDTREHVSSEYRILLPDGEERMVYSEGMLEYDESGKPVRVVGIIQDITERKRMEETLRESEEEFRLIFENANNAIFWIDPETNLIINCNNAAETLLEKTRDDILEQELVTLFPPQRAEYYTTLFEISMEQKGTVDDEAKVITKSGRIKSVHITASRIQVGERQIIQGTFLDITERKHVRELLVEKGEELVRTNAELRATQRQLTETAHQAGMAEIATNVLHNVGNILNTSITSSTILAERAQRFDVPALVKLAELVARHESDFSSFVASDPKGRKVPALLGQLAEALSMECEGFRKELRNLAQSHEYIREIVALQQSYAGISGVKEELKLSELVNNALQLVGGSLERHGIKISLEQKEELPDVLLEKHKVLQILVNLVRNARDAVKAGKSKERRITVRTGKAGKGRVKIQVVDNGVGIDPKDIDRIFTYGHTAKPGGHGYGLHGSANAAGEMGGSLTAHSDGPGKGAVFTLILPVK